MKMYTPSGSVYTEERDWPWPGAPWPWCSLRIHPHDAHIDNGGNIVCPGVPVTLTIHEEE